MIRRHHDRHFLVARVEVDLDVPELLRGLGAPDALRRFERPGGPPFGVELLDLDLARNRGVGLLEPLRRRTLPAGDALQDVAPDVEAESEEREKQHPLYEADLTEGHASSSVSRPRSPMRRNFW